MHPLLLASEAANVAASPLASAIFLPLAGAVLVAIIPAART